MEVSREDLAARFREMSDEELQGHLRSGDLSPLAVEVATSTLSSRGVAPSSSPAGEGATADTLGVPVDTGIKLVTVAEAFNSVEANIIRRLLESHGLFATVWGEYTPVGWLEFRPGFLPRVQVRNDQEAQAREVLAAMKRGELELPDTFDAEGVPESSDSEAKEEPPLHLSFSHAPPCAARPTAGYCRRLPQVP